MKWTKLEVEHTHVKSRLYFIKKRSSIHPYKGRSALYWAFNLNLFCCTGVDRLDKDLTIGQMQGRWHLILQRHPVHVFDMSEENSL